MPLKTVAVEVIQAFGHLYQLTLQKDPTGAQEHRVLHHEILLYPDRPDDGGYYPHLPGLPVEDRALLERTAAL